MGWDPLWSYKQRSGLRISALTHFPVFRWTQGNRYIVVQDWLFQFVDSPDKCEIDLLLFKNFSYQNLSLFLHSRSITSMFSVIFRFVSIFYFYFLFFSIYSIFFEVILISFAFVFQVFFPSSFFMMCHTCLNKPGKTLVLPESGKPPLQLRGAISNGQRLACIRSGTSHSW